MSNIVGDDSVDLVAKSARTSEISSEHPGSHKESVQEALTRIEWGFSDRESSALEAIHPYPAKFIPEIPGSLLDELPVASGTVVFDPFCGSGTTLVESQRRGLRSIGIDLNPIACLITRVKTSPVPAGLQSGCVQSIRAAQSNRTPDRAAIPNVDHWFRPDVQNSISALRWEINQVDDPALKDALRLALSSILVRVSNQDSDTRYAAVTKPVSSQDVFGHFATAVAKLENALQARSYPLPEAITIEADTLAFDASRISEKVGIVVTSPPYPNAYEYWLYHKYRMWWLGFDPIAVKEREIGARAHFFKRNHHTEHDFHRQMAATFALIDRALVKGGYACVVIGRSKIHGRIVDNASIIELSAANCGMKKIARFERLIPGHRKSFNLSHANIKSESILIFQKPSA